MKKRGFTLIELLAVIIVLSLILIITVPIVSDIIENGRKEAFRNNVLNLFDAVKQLESEGVYKLDNKGISATDSRLKLSNNPFTGGNIVLDENNNAYSYKVTNGVYCALGNKKSFSVLKGNCELSTILSNIEFEPEPDNNKWSEGKKITIKTNLSEEEMQAYDITFSIVDRTTTDQRIFKEITEQNTELYFGKYEDISAKEWYESNYGLKFNNDLDKANIIVKVSNQIEEQSVTYQVTMVDSTAPENPSLRLIKRNISSMYVMAGAIEDDSYIKSYQFKLEKKSESSEAFVQVQNWSSNGTNPLVMFNNLEKDTDYRVSVRIENAVGTVTEFSRVFTPAELESPIIEITPSNENKWEKSRTAVITFPANRKDITETEKNDYKYEYKIVKRGERAESKDYTEVNCEEEKDNMGNVTCKTDAIIISESSDVIAKVSVNGGNVDEEVTRTAYNIDSIKPVIKSLSHYVDNKQIRAHINVEEITDEYHESPIDTYRCSIDGGKTWKEADGTICKFENLESGKEYSIKVEVEDEAGNVGEITKSGIKTLSADPAITLQTQNVTENSKTYKNVKITFPNLGNAAKYRYQIIESGDEISEANWIEPTSITVTTNTIKTNNTTIVAEVVYEDIVIDKSITVDIDKTAPTITFSRNGYSSYTTGTSTKVTVYDEYGGDTTTYKYIWTTGSSTPTTSFSSGQTIYTPDSTGEYYLRVTACDIYGNCDTVKSNVFYLDNTAPSCGTTSQTGVSDTVTGSVRCIDYDSGCESTTFYGTYSSNGYKSIYIYDNVGNYRSCSVYISNVSEKDTTKPECGTTRQSSKSSSVTGYVGCSDSDSGCVQSEYSSTFTSNGTYTIRIYDKEGNYRDCSITISNVVTYPTITWGNANNSNTKWSGDGICCNGYCKSGGYCYYAKFIADRKSQTVTSSSYLQMYMKDVSSQPYTKYYSSTGTWSFGSGDAFGAYFGASDWYISRSSSEFTQRTAKICVTGNLCATLTK